MTTPIPLASTPLFDDDLVAYLLGIPENNGYEARRVGDNTRKIQTIVAFANSNGGLLALGLEDEGESEGP